MEIIWFSFASLLVFLSLSLCLSKIPQKMSQIFRRLDLREKLLVSYYHQYKVNRAEMCQIKYCTSAQNYTEGLISCGNKILNNRSP